MADYETQGTLKTDSRQITNQQAWDSQSEWEAYQSKNNIVVNNGTLSLLEAIPESVVSRPEDDNSSSFTDALGARIETQVEWPRIGARLSANNQDFTRAYVYDASSGNLMGDVDISSLSAGDTFTIDLDTALAAGNRYNFVIDAEGSSYTIGFYSSPSFPYTSSDGNLSIINGALNETGSTNKNNVRGLVEIGNVGFA